MKQKTLKRISQSQSKLRFGEYGILWFNGRGFFIFSIFVMGLCIRNDDPSLLNAADSSDITIAPFTLVFEVLSELTKRAGISWAAHLMNGVIFSAVLSASNSALYAASRTLMALSQEGKAPSLFSKLNKNNVPVYSIIATSVIGCISFLGIFIGSGAIFTLLIQITGICGILTWCSISVIHIRFRKAFTAQKISIDDTLVYKAPFYPLGPIVALILGFGIIIAQGYAAFSTDNPVRNLVVTYSICLW